MLNDFLKKFNDCLKQNEVHFLGGNITVQSSDSLIWFFFLFVNNDIFTNLIYQKKPNIFHKALGEDLNEKEVSTYSIVLRLVPIFF